MENDYKTAMRTILCGHADSAMEGSTVSVCGWVNKTRDHGNLIFIDVRDRSGIVQVFSNDKSIASLLSELRLEDVVQITGTVRKRPDEMINREIPTGSIEIECSNLKVLAKSSVPPFVVEDDVKASENLRLKYRYLDLRRPTMQEILKKRSDTYRAMRNYLTDKGFMEIETPVMSRSTPEGARDYIVPSRVHPGKFYALVQSPQLYKQLLMVSGIDRYFQFARCFRDEDLRADRQPEHTQIDMEMSFVEKEDIFRIVEGLMKHTFSSVIDTELKIPFPVMSYREAMDRFGTDKPDLRFSLELIDITPKARASDSNILKDNEYTGGIFVTESLSRKEIDRLTDFIKSAGAAGLGYIKVKEDKNSGPFAKFLEVDDIFNSQEGVFFIMSGKKRRTQEYLGMLRNRIAAMKDIRRNNDFNFLWVTDFPLFDWDEEEERYEPFHHLFTMPSKQFIGRIAENPLEVTGELYDLVCNGVELASGSIRIHEYEIQKEVMEIIGIGEEELESKFGFLMEAFKYGAPPHGGIAPGLDRLIMTMMGLDNIRDTIAFPKTLNAVGLMEECPSSVDRKQTDELHIIVKEDKK